MRIPSAIIAVSALVAVSVSIGASAGADESGTTRIVQVYSPWITTTSSPSPGGVTDIRGTAPGGTDVVTVTVRNSAGSGVFCVAAVPQGSNDWHCEVQERDLALGTNILSAVATDHGFPNDDASHLGGQSIVIERVAAVTFTAPVGDYTNDSTPDFAGTATGTTVDVVTSGSTLCTAQIVGSTWSCTSQPLPDGTYDVQASASPGPNVSGTRSLTIDTVAPNAPVITTPVASGEEGSDATTSDVHQPISGTGESHAIVTLFDGDAQVTCNTTPIVVDDSGAWSCTPTEELAPGTHLFSAIQTDRAGNSSSGGPAFPQLRLTVAPQAPPDPPRITAPVGPEVGGTANAETSDPRPRLSGTGRPGATLIILMDGEPTGCAEDPIVVDADGTWACTLSSPLEPGTYAFSVIETGTTPPDDAAPQLRLTALAPAVTPPPASKPNPVTPPPAARSPQLPTLALPQQAEVAPAPVVTPKPIAPPAPTRSATTPRPTDTAAPAGIRDDPAAPSFLTNALPTLQGILSNPATIATAAGSGAALLLLVAFPAELLNETLSRQYERLFGGFRKLRVGWWERLRARIATAPIVGGTTVTVLAALIFGFADPNFGFDLTSLRLVLGCGIALFIVGYAASAITGWIARDRWRVGTMLEIKPLALVLTVVGVLLSRLLEFSPGFLIGLLLGVSLTGATTIRQRARTVLFHSGVILALCLLAWFGYSMIIAVNGPVPGGFLEALTLDTLAAITAEGLTALLIGLLPFRYLEGEEVFAVSKPLWAASYLIALVTFCLIVVPDVANWESLGDSLWLWLGIVIAFSVLSLGTYLFFRRLPPETQHSEPERERTGAR